MNINKRKCYRITMIYYGFLLLFCVNVSMPLAINAPALKNTEKEVNSFELLNQDESTPTPFLIASGGNPTATFTPFYTFTPTPPPPTLTPWVPTWTDTPTPGTPTPSLTPTHTFTPTSTKTPYASFWNCWQNNYSGQCSIASMQDAINFGTCIRNICGGLPPNWRVSCATACATAHFGAASVTCMIDLGYALTQCYSYL